jgi:hypothetical protein
METWLPVLRDPAFGYKFSGLCDRTVAPADPPPSVVMIGSSRTGFGLRGQLAEEQLGRELGRSVVVYNFGSPGAGPTLELVYLKRLLAAGVKPNLLLLEVLPPLLGGPGPVPMEAHWLAAQRFTHAELRLLEAYGFPPEVYRRDWWQARPLPWYGHRFALVSWASPQLLPYELRQDWGRGADDSGWIPVLYLNPGPDQHRQKVERVCREYTAYFQGFHLCESSCRAQRKLLQTCRRQGIPAALVLMPEGTEFRQLYPPGAWTEIETFLNCLRREFAVPIIDARHWIRDDDFIDSHHLLPQGAAAFTERLVRDEVLPLLRSQASARRANTPRSPAALR